MFLFFWAWLRHIAFMHEKVSRNISKVGGRVDSAPLAQNGSNCMANMAVPDPFFHGLVRCAIHWRLLQMDEERIEVKRHVVTCWPLAEFHSCLK